MSNLQTYYHFQLNFQKVDQHTGKYLTHDTKRPENQYNIPMAYVHGTVFVCLSIIFLH